jgi:aminopeptidase N
MPGVMSQSWPSLVYLSTFSFLNAEEKSRLNMSPVRSVLTDAVAAHETAHQWWGDSVTWSDYHDQWIMEGLANYSALMLLESENSARFRAALGKYRDDLLEKNHADKRVMEAGPITLGTRLSSSEFPEGYEAISYGRGTWLFHMLRCMMRDGEEKSGLRSHRKEEIAEEPFFRALRKVREQYQGKSITIRELFQAFEEQLPHSLWYDGHQSLDWFYQSWVNGTAVPNLEVSGVKYVPKNGMSVVSGNILQKSAPDDLVTSVPVYAVVAGKNVYLGRVFADGPQTQFHFTVPVGTHKVVLDPNQTVLTQSR